eukprot:TRINITY_DN4272_c0_g4_i1.p2 TRINITY_DN4272_c0_g4~~TRINITY_DN4272_c0_g4_i1.p2  ORF type:complete len:295 (+),score=97.30 TRINITY_DN4272_c0_g4_i1:95-979(+)
MDRAYAGAAAASVAEVCTMPVDTAKVRLQMNKQGFGRLLPTLRGIAVNEGPRALYRGAAPAVMRQGGYSALCFYGFDGAGIPRNTYMQKLMLGGTVGALSVILVNPLDVVKVRMQSGAYSYSGVGSALGSIARSEGAAGLFAGVAPAAQRAFVVNAAELGTYAQAKEMICEMTGSSGCETHFLASLCAGFASVMASNPLDVAKTRLMTNRGPRSSLIRTVVETVRTEGPAALYKGAFPNWLRKGPHCAIQFVLYEQFSALLKRMREEDALALVAAAAQDRLGVAPAPAPLPLVR